MIRRPPRSTLFPYTRSSDLVVSSIVLGSPRAGLYVVCPIVATVGQTTRSEEHTSELQSRLHLVCRLLLEKKNKLVIRILPTGDLLNMNVLDVQVTYVSTDAS